MLHQPDTDILFPVRAIRSLRNLRGPEWRALVDQVSQHESEQHPDVLAFILMMVRQNSCLTCHPHTFRAMRGCMVCAQQIIARYKGTDQELIQSWETTRQEILTFQLSQLAEQS